MKKMSLLILALVSSMSAHADYFSCSLEQFDQILATEEAPYRVKEAKVTAEGFECEGKISGDKIKVKIKDKNTDREKEVVLQGSQASTYLSTLPSHNEFDMICSCGMN
jgi:hypothetical protein